MMCSFIAMDAKKASRGSSSGLSRMVSFTKRVVLKELLEKAVRSTAAISVVVGRCECLLALAFHVNALRYEPGTVAPSTAPVHEQCVR
jgi:hypothetical protein